MLRMSDKELLGDRPVQRLVMGEWRMRGFSFDPTWIRTLPAKLAGVRGVVATLGLILFALTSPSHAQAPPLRTAANFGVIAGSGVTNAPLTITTINGDLGLSPNSLAAITGFDFSGPPGLEATIGRRARSATPPASTTVSRPTRWSASRSGAAAPTSAYRAVTAADATTCSSRPSTA